MAVISESLRRLVAAGASSLLRNELDDGLHSASSLSSTLSSTVPDPPSSLPSSLPCTPTSSVPDPPSSLTSSDLTSTPVPQSPTCRGPHSLRPFLPQLLTHHRPSHYCASGSSSHQTAVFFSLAASL